MTHAKVDLGLYKAQLTETLATITRAVRELNESLDSEFDGMLQDWQMQVDERIRELYRAFQNETDTAYETVAGIRAAIQDELDAAQAEPESQIQALLESLDEAAAELAEIREPSIDIVLESPMLDEEASGLIEDALDALRKLC
jgi:DNA anti-recombination protein RmuC